MYGLKLSGSLREIAVQHSIHFYSLHGVILKNMFLRVHVTLTAPPAYVTVCDLAAFKLWVISCVERYLSYCGPLKAPY